MHQLLSIAILSIHIWPNNKTNICTQANVFAIILILVPRPIPSKTFSESFLVTLSTHTHTHTHTRTHTHTQPFYGPFSGTTRVSRCQNRTSGLYGERAD